MSVGVDAASNMALERPADSHPLAAAAHCQRSPHRYFGEATCGGEYRAGRRALLFTLKKLRGRT